MPQRFSQQRERIYQTVLESRAHPTAEMVYQQLKPEMPRLSLGTVYRNLSLMTDAGEVRRITVPEHPDRYDGDVSPHDHLLCMKCKKLFDIGSVGVDLKKSDIPTGTLVLGYEVTVKTICPACAGAESK